METAESFTFKGIASRSTVILADAESTSLSELPTVPAPPTDTTIVSAEAHGDEPGIIDAPVVDDPAVDDPEELYVEDVTEHRMYDAATFTLLDQALKPDGFEGFNLIGWDAYTIYVREPDGSIDYFDMTAIVVTGEESVDLDWYMAPKDAAAFKEWFVKTFVAFADDGFYSTLQDQVADESALSGQVESHAEFDGDTFHFYADYGGDDAKLIGWDADSIFVREDDGSIVHTAVNGDAGWFVPPADAADLKSFLESNFFGLL